MRISKTKIDFILMKINLIMWMKTKTDTIKKSWMQNRITKTAILAIISLIALKIYLANRIMHKKIEKIHSLIRN